MSDHSSLTGGIAERYATALFDLATEAKVVDAVEKDLDGLDGLLKESVELRRLVTSPLFSREDQAKAMGAVLDKAGAHKITKNFVGLVARNRRLFALPNMIAAFRQLLADERGEVTARVTSARALKDKQVEALKKALHAALGKDVKLDLAVDEELLGGLIVKVGSRMIDSSIRTKLNNLKIAMKEAG